MKDQNPRVKLFKFTVSIMIVVCFSLMYVYILSKGNTNSQVVFYKNNFRSQRESFDNMKDRILILQQEYNTESIELWLKYPYDQDYFEIGEVQIHLTMEEVGWLKNIGNAFGTEALSRIIYDDERILFGADGNAIAFVYTVDGKKPIYMSTPDEYWKWKRTELGNNWYCFLAD